MCQITGPWNVPGAIMWICFFIILMLQCHQNADISHSSDLKRPSAQSKVMISGYGLSEFDKRIHNIYMNYFCAVRNDVRVSAPTLFIFAHKNDHGGLITWVRICLKWTEMHWKAVKTRFRDSVPPVCCVFGGRGPSWMTVPVHLPPCLRSRFSWVQFTSTEWQYFTGVKIPELFVPLLYYSQIFWLLFYTESCLKINMSPCFCYSVSLDCHGLDFVSLRATRW